MNFREAKINYHDTETGIDYMIVVGFSDAVVREFCYQGDEDSAVRSLAGEVSGKLQFIENEFKTLEEYSGERVNNMFTSTLLMGQYVELIIRRSFSKRKKLMKQSIAVILTQEIEEYHNSRR